MVTRVQCFPGRLTRNHSIRAVFERTAELGAPEFELEDFRIGRTWHRRPDIVHLHWPENTVSQRSLVRSIATGLALIASLQLSIAFGARLVRTRHDLSSHSGRRPSLQRRLDRWIDRRLDTLVVCGEEQRPVIGNDLADRTIVIELTRAPGPLDRSVDRRSARAVLGLPDGPLVGAIGRILPYKQLPGLVDSFVDAALPEVTLVVAGENLDPSFRPAEHPRVLQDLRPLDLEEYELYLRAVDVVVLAYRGHLNSGVLLDALDQPTRVAATPSSAVDALASRHPEWIHTFGRPEGFTWADLLSAFRWSMTPEPTGNVPALPSIDEAAGRTLDLYRSVAGGRGR